MRVYTGSTPPCRPSWQSVQGWLYGWHGGWQRGSARRCLTLFTNLISLECLPVAAGGNVAGKSTDLDCAGCGAPHRCIGWSPPKRWEDKECWLVPELHPREHDPASLGILHDPLGLLPAICNCRHPLGARGLGPIRLGGHSGGGVHMMGFTEKVRRQGVNGRTASPKGNHMFNDG